MELREIVALAWKRRWIVLAVLAMTAAASALFAFSQARKYEATVTVVIQPDLERGSGFVASDALSALLGTYAATVESRAVRSEAATRLGHPLRGKVKASTEAGTGVLRVTGRAETPEDALETAQAAAGAFVDRLDETSQVLVPDIVDPGVLPTSAVQPRPPLIIATGVLLGLIAGILVALAVEHFRRRIENVEDIERITPAPVLGRVPPQRFLAKQGPAVAATDPRLHAFWESMRSLRTNVQLVTDGNPGPMQVTSSEAGVGKSTITANLAAAMASLGIPTVVVDADLSKPAQHEIFGVPAEWGVNTLLADPTERVRPLPTAIDNLYVVPAGTRTLDASDRLHVGLPRLLGRLAELDMLVMIDSPPLLQVSDARVIARHAAKVLLVVAAGRERPSALADAVRALELANAQLAGVVLNLFAPREDPYGYGAAEGVPRESTPLGATPG